jgi:hypothetical protein
MEEKNNPQINAHIQVQGNVCENSAQFTSRERTVLKISHVITKQENC